MGRQAAVGEGAAGGCAGSALHFPAPVGCVGGLLEVVPFVDTRGQQAPSLGPQGCCRRVGRRPGLVWPGAQGLPLTLRTVVVPLPGPLGEGGDRHRFC